MNSDSSTSPSTDTATPVTAERSRQGRRTAALGLLRCRTVYVPTWRGWLLALLLMVGLGAVVLLGVHPYLAVTDPRPGGILVLEGWAPDYAVHQAAGEYDRGGYQGFYVTGGPIEKGAPLVEYKDVASLGAAGVRAERPDLANVVVAVPAPPVKADRTYASAVALREWLAANGKQVKRVNLVSVGPHARRSRYYFQKAFGKDVEVGVIAIEDQGYNARRWWTSSYGFHAVTGEMIAYFYSLFD